MTIASEYCHVKQTMTSAISIFMFSQLKSVLTKTKKKTKKCGTPATIEENLSI